MADSLPLTISHWSTTWRNLSFPFLPGKQSTPFLFQPARCAPQTHTQIYATKSSLSKQQANMCLLVTWALSTHKGTVH